MQILSNQKFLMNLSILRDALPGHLMECNQSQATLAWDSVILRHCILQKGKLRNG